MKNSSLFHAQQERVPGAGMAETLPARPGTCRCSPSALPSYASLKMPIDLGPCQLSTADTASHLSTAVLMHSPMHSPHCKPPAAAGSSALISKVVRLLATRPVKIMATPGHTSGHALDTVATLCVLTSTSPLQWHGEGNHQKYTKRIFKRCANLMVLPKTSSC